MSILLHPIADKYIVWFQPSNSYLIFETLVAKILSKIDAHVSQSDIEDWCMDHLEAPKAVIHDFVNDVYTLYQEHSQEITTTVDTLHIETIPANFHAEKYYQVHQRMICIQYESDYHELKIHPTFAHLEIECPLNIHHYYTLFNQQERLVFVKDGQLIGSWPQSEAHVFEGKVSMELVMDCYQKQESDWMGVFHASAVSNGKETLLFLGDSGNGKSTSLALLNAHGFNCMADDFVPVDIHQKVHTYPAGISIKKKSIPTLLPFYPELEETAEYHFTKLNKTVRFIAPSTLNYSQQLNCKALVFINYNPTVPLELRPMSKIDAFQQLVPDAWISPLEKNANVFLKWFDALPCYSLTYADNDKMIATVTQLMNDEL